METKKETALGRPIDYEINELPKSVKLEVGKWYDISDGSYGERSVKIVSIRNLNGQIVIHYKWMRDSELFGILSKWNYGNTMLDTFKVWMLDYGKISSINIIHPESKKR